MNALAFDTPPRPAFTTRHGDCRFCIRSSLRVVPDTWRPGDAVTAPDIGRPPMLAGITLAADHYARCERAVRCACRGRVIGRDNTTRWPT